MKSFILRVDHRFAVWACSGRRSPAIRKFYEWITQSGTGRAWAIAVPAAWYTGRAWIPNYPEFMNALLVPLAAWVFSSVLKRLIARRRPFQCIDGLPASLISAPENQSFPSAHASSSFAFFFGLVLSGHPWTALVGTWALVVTYSRLYLGVHYLSDIFGGVAIGAVCALLVQATI